MHLPSPEKNGGYYQTYSEDRPDRVASRYTDLVDLTHFAKKRIFTPLSRILQEFDTHDLLVIAGADPDNTQATFNFLYSQHASVISKNCVFVDASRSALAAHYAQFPFTRTVQGTIATFFTEQQFDFLHEEKIRGIIGLDLNSSEPLISVAEQFLKYWNKSLQENIFSPDCFALFCTEQPILTIDQPNGVTHSLDHYGRFLDWKVKHEDNYGPLPINWDVEYVYEGGFGQINHYAFSLK